MHCSPEHIDNPWEELEVEIASILEEDPDRDLPAGGSAGVPPASTVEARVALHMESVDDVGQTAMVEEASAAAGASTAEEAAHSKAVETAAKLLSLLGDDMVVKTAMKEQLKNLEVFMEVSTHNSSIIYCALSTVVY